jgi:hypothetical protein
MNAIDDENGQIGEQFIGLLNSRRTLGGLTTNPEVVLRIEEGTEFLAERNLITDQEHADH